VDQDCDGVSDNHTDAFDDDDDGWTEADGDCDDGDAHTFPGASERTDGRDQDCDGVAEVVEGWCGGGGAALLVLPLFIRRRRATPRA
jgi:hypothetical protein